MVPVLLLRRIKFNVSILLLILLQNAANAETLYLPITFDSYIDSRSYDNSDHFNFGYANTDKVAVNSRDNPTSICRTLFQLPVELWNYAPERIISAKVVFYVWQDNSGPRNVSLFPLTTNFVQGTGSGYWQPDPVDGATWWTRDGTNAWSTPGGDFDATHEVMGIKEDYLDPDYGDRFFHWDITELLQNVVASNELRQFGAMLKIDERPYPPSPKQYWAAFTSSQDPSYLMPYRPHVALELVPEPPVLFDFVVNTEVTGFGISNLTINTTNFIERSTDIRDSNSWETVAMFMAASNTTNWWEITPPSRTSMFYRVRSQLP